MLSVIDDHAVALLQTQFLGHFAAHQHQMAQEIGVSILGRRKLRNWLARYNQKMGGRLGRNIIKCHTLNKISAIKIIE